LVSLKASHQQSALFVVQELGSLGPVGNEELGDNSNAAGDDTFNDELLSSAVVLYALIVGQEQAYNPSPSTIPVRACVT
jgi:hypothetical protein